MHNEAAERLRLGIQPGDKPTPFVTATATHTIQHGSMLGPQKEQVENLISYHWSLNRQLPIFP